jgi:hypothetical protein
MTAGVGRGSGLIDGGALCCGVFGTTVVASPSSSADPRSVPGQSAVVSASRSSSGAFIGCQPALTGTDAVGDLSDE